jgi:hypothetical protein
VYARTAAVTERLPNTLRATHTIGAYPVNTYFNPFYVSTGGDREDRPNGV